MKEKLWSPHKERKCWIVWYEDQEGPGDKSVYANRMEAEAYLHEMVQDVTESELKDLDPEDEDATETREILMEILEALRKSTMTGYGLWGDHHDNVGLDMNVHFEEARLFGA
jgi:hypothetical protein